MNKELSRALVASVVAESIMDHIGPWWNRKAYAEDFRQMLFTNADDSRAESLFQGLSEEMGISTKAGLHEYPGGEDQLFDDVLSRIYREVGIELNPGTMNFLLDSSRRLLWGTVDQWKESSQRVLAELRVPRPI